MLPPSVADTSVSTVASDGARPFLSDAIPGATAAVLRLSGEIGPTVRSSDSPFAVILPIACR